MSAATDTTSKFVEVPIVVLIPPIIVASPIGSRMPEVEVRLRIAAPISIGSISTTMGVLFMNALSTAPTTSVASSASTGARFQKRLRRRATGSSAPVRTSACPATISAHTATSASWPKPWKNSEGFSSPSGLSKGNRPKPMIRATRTNRLEDSSGIFSRVKRIKASTVMASAAMAWGLGRSGKYIPYPREQNAPSTNGCFSVCVIYPSNEHSPSQEFHGHEPTIITLNCTRKRPEPPENRPFLH
jgi:hypothetical protein